MVILDLPKGSKSDRYSPNTTGSKPCAPEINLQRGLGLWGGGNFCIPRGEKGLSRESWKRKTEIAGEDNMQTKTSDSTYLQIAVSDAELQIFQKCFISHQV